MTCTIYILAPVWIINRLQQSSGKRLTLSTVYFVIKSEWRTYEKAYRLGKPFCVASHKRCMDSLHYRDGVGGFTVQTSLDILDSQGIGARLIRGKTIDFNIVVIKG